MLADNQRPLRSRSNGATANLNYSNLHVAAATPDDVSSAALSWKLHTKQTYVHVYEAIPLHNANKLWPSSIPGNSMNHWQKCTVAGHVCGTCVAQACHLHNAGQLWHGSPPVNACIDQLLDLHVIGHLPLVIHPSLAVPGPCEVLGAARYEGHCQGAPKQG